MTRILGITIGGSSTAALYENGKIVSCATEERFVKKKNYEGYPINAIEFCLNYSGVKPEEIDFIALASHRFDHDRFITHSESNRSVSDFVREMHEYSYPMFYGGVKRDYLDVFKDKIDLAQYPGNFDGMPLEPHNRINYFKDFKKKTISKHLDYPPEKICVIEHHLAHAAYALLGSSLKFDEALVFTADGFGDYSNASLRRFQNGKFTLEYETDICNIGRLYRYITLLLGMKPTEDEYKVMGLSAYSHPRIYKEVLNILEDTLYVDGIEYKYKTRPVDHYFWFQKRFEGQRFDAIAGGLQKYVENLLITWVRNAVKKYGIYNVTFSGGVSMNIKANLEIMRIPEVSYISIPGSGGDESLAIGAIFAFLLKSGVSPDEIETINDLYLGSSFSLKEIDRFIQENNLQAQYNITPHVTPIKVAELLAKGEVIGRFAGRMEFGQRALGNRSIIAAPSRRDTVRIINNIIKQRDFWMPFAPTILYEDCDRYLCNPKRIYSPFMTIGFETKPEAHKDLIAALHPTDFTARPQMLKKEVNPEYYDIIAQFKELTGIGGVLNTSFNLHGLPIVESLSDAFHVMNNSDMRFLLLENILLEKKLTR